ncbi:UNVERIFIED_CONTAM: hypothetical protein HHA_281650 [Hammondia hammondi]|eukprot:XP_008887600.1 hypothetical protein HHA_281650 [Hammondia hammondi]
MDEEVVSSVVEEESEQTSLASSDDEGDEAFARDLDAEMSALLSQLQPPAKPAAKSLAPGLPKKAGLSLHARKKLPALVPPKNMAFLGVKAKTSSLSVPEAGGAGSAELTETGTASPSGMYTPQDLPSREEGAEEEHEAEEEHGREDESHPDATLQKKAFPRPPSVKPTPEKSPSLFPRPPKLGGPADSKSKAIPKPILEHRPAPSAPLRMPPKATAEPQSSAAGPMTQSPAAAKFPRPAKVPAQEKAEHAKKAVLPKQFGKTLGANAEAPKKTAAASKSFLPPQSLFPRPPPLLPESSPLASQPSSPLSTSSPFPESPAYPGSPPHPPATPHAAASPYPSAFPHPGSPPELRAPLPDVLSHPNAPKELREKETGACAEGAVWETRGDRAGGDSDEGRGRRVSTATSESVEVARRRAARAIPARLAGVAHRKLETGTLATETEAVRGRRPGQTREAGDSRNAHHLLDVDDECRQFAAHILDEAEADAEATATAEVSGDITGEIWLDEILESESDSDLDPLDHRWGMLLSDPRWELQRTQPRYQYTPVVQASYVASCPFGTSVGVRAPPYRSLYRRPKNYVVGVSYLRHYELPTVSRLLKAPAPEFLRKRPWTKHPEAFKGMPLGGGLHFEIDLCGGKARRAGREEGNVSQRRWTETRRSSRANRDAAWLE